MLRAEALAGQNVGKYYVIRKIGRGGMAHVYEARDTELDYTVALKVLDGSRATGDRFVSRFQREARLASRLKHPNIVRIFDVSETDGLFYFAMEYVDGQTLDKILDKAKESGPPIALNNVIKLFEQIVIALMYAYNVEKIIHRDIKPANIIVDNNGHVRLTDFGIARALDEESELTSDSIYIGTPLYMSPEHVIGRGIDHRSDVYSLGVVLYEMLANCGPFGNGLSTPELIHKHRYERPLSLRRFNSAVNTAIEQVVQRALEKNPQQRFQTADEMLVALTRAYNTLDHRPAHQVIPRWAIPLALATLFVSLLSLVTMAFLFYPGLANSGATPTPAPPTVIPSTAVDMVIVTTRVIHMRAGPAQIYDEVGLLESHTRLQLLAVESRKADWVKVKAPDDTQGWVGVAELDMANLDLGATLPVGVIPPTPTPKPDLFSGVVATPTDAVQPTSPTSTPLKSQPARPATSTPASTFTPMVDPGSPGETKGPSCPVEALSPANFAVFTSADEIKLTWSSGALASNQNYRLSFFRPDGVYLNALLTRNTFSIKKAGEQNWSYPENSEWIAGIKENAAYMWVVEVIDAENNSLCKTEGRNFFWHLK